MKNKKRFKFALTSILVICIMVVFGVCAVAMSNTATEQAAVSQSSEVTAKIKTPFIITFVHDTPDAFGKIKGVMFIGTKVVVKEQKGTFWLVENKNELKGYVFKSWVNTDKKNFNREYDHVYVGGTNAISSGKPRAYFQYNGDGTVRYSTTTPDIISVDSETGVVTAKKTGTATLCARVGIRTESIPIYCIYKWKKPWTGETNKQTAIYAGPSSLTTKVITVPNNWNFYVKGDDGTDDGWAYGYANYKGEERWGFVKINNISTKGTVSQYNNMGWTWPLKDPSINFISSPYAPRSDSTASTIHHRGMDLTTGTPGEIKGEPIVAAYSGTVKTIRTNIDSCGHCISISSDSVDPVTGERIAMIYMHMQSEPAYSNDRLIKRGDRVNAGTEIGKVGRSNGGTSSSMGYHLHFETNNKNAGVGDSGRSNFVNTINPIYFYKNKDITLSEICEAYSNNYGAYWYAYNN